jgi:hypothetical protein
MFLVLIVEDWANDCKSHAQGRINIPVVRSLRADQWIITFKDRLQCKPCLQTEVIHEFALPGRHSRAPRKTHADIYRALTHVVAGPWSTRCCGPEGRVQPIDQVFCCPQVTSQFSIPLCHITGERRVKLRQIRRTQASRHVVARGGRIVEVVATRHIVVRLCAIAVARNLVE